MIRVTLRIDDPDLEAAWEAIPAGKRSELARRALVAYLRPEGWARDVLDRLQEIERLVRTGGTRGTPGADPILEDARLPDALAGSVAELLDW